MYMQVNGDSLILCVGKTGRNYPRVRFPTGLVAGLDMHNVLCSDSSSFQLVKTQHGAK